MPNGYKIVRQSLVDDLEGEKKVCWETEILQDDDSGFTYEISRCLYFDTCKEHGYAEFCKVFWLENPLPWWDLPEAEKPRSALSCPDFMM